MAASLSWGAAIGIFLGAFAVAKSTFCETHILHIFPPDFYISLPLIFGGLYVLRNFYIIIHTCFRGVDEEKKARCPSRGYEGGGEAKMQKDYEPFL